MALVQIQGAEHVENMHPSVCAVGNKMTSLRKRKSRAMRSLRRRRWLAAEREALLWDQMPPVGREFGSPDFERLMEEDYRSGVGVFDPSRQRQKSRHNLKE